MIGRLEHAGLGYHVHADETRDRLGELLDPEKHLDNYKTEHFILQWLI